MIDEECDTVTYTEVTEEIEISKVDDSGSPITEGNNVLISKKRGPRKNLSDLRTPRQKFCTRWQVQFPWLKANRIDESVGFCTICNKELVCKKSHLERHQKSFKHIRLQGFENIFTLNMPEAELVDAHTNGYMESESEFQDELDVLEEDGVEYTTIKVEPISMTDHELKASLKKCMNVEKPVHAPIPLPAIESVKAERPTFNISPRSTERPREQAPAREPERQREHERPRVINDYYYMQPPVPPKDSFDLFFESVSATVKALPPRLGAEVKSKVSQLIANFELRAICEQEAQDKAAAESVSVGNMVSVTPIINSISSGSEMPATVTHSSHANGQAVAHYVYSYQPK